MKSNSSNSSRASWTRTMSKLRRGIGIVQRLLHRPLRLQWLVFEAAVTLWVIKAILVWLPFERWRAILQRPIRQGTNPPLERVAEVVWAVDRVSQRWPKALPCLPRAVTVHSMMARRHWNCQLELGVALDAEGRFEAHAWVEHLGQIIIGHVPDMSRFAKLSACNATERAASRDESLR
jgi:hypothetical protein